MGVPSNLIPTRITQLPQDPSPSDQGWLIYVNNGATYRVRAADILSLNGVPVTRQVIAGTGLAGGGQLADDVTLSVAPGGIGSTELDATGVTPGTYGTPGQVPVMVVDANGRVAAATSVAASLDAGSQLTGIVPLANGGAGRNLVPVEGAIIWCDVDGLHVGPAGLPGQVLISGGGSEYTWGSALIIADQPANYVYAGPASGPAGPTGFRALVNADLAYSSITINGTEVALGGSIAIGGVTTFDGGTTGLTPATATFGAVSLGGTLVVANGGTGATDAATARLNLTAAASGTNADITAMSGITGGIASPDFIQFDAALSTLPTDATGRLYYDNSDQFQTLVFQMNGSVVQHVGEEVFYRIRCQGAITKGQVVAFAGTLGASGGLIGKAATGLLPTQSNYVIGVADETGANNDWIFVTSFGEVKNVNTSAWAQGDVLYYDPTVAGGLTNVKPTAPNAIAVVAAVVHVHASNGIIFVRPTYGNVFGGTDVNAQFSSLANNDVVVYNAANSRWENYAPSATRTALGLGTIATQNANSVDIDGGSIDGTTIGANSAAAGTFTTVTATSGISGGTF